MQVTQNNSKLTNGNIEDELRKWNKNQAGILWWTEAAKFYNNIQRYSSREHFAYLPASKEISVIF